MAEFVVQSAWAGTSDRLLDQIYKDLNRAIRTRPEFLLKEAHYSSTTGAQGSTDRNAMAIRHVLLDRLAVVNRDYASSVQNGQHRDLLWHSMLRVLFLYSLLNPSVGYIQGMHEVLYVILNVFTVGATPSADAPPRRSEEGLVLGIGSPESVEADAFWCFSLLIGELHELYDFAGGDIDTLKAMRSLDSPLSHTHDNGMVQALNRFSNELHSLDPELHDFLAIHSAHPRLPYYSFRWLACLYASDFPLPAVVQIWDVMLAQQFERRVRSSGNTNEKIGFLIDVGCALMLQVRSELMYPKPTKDGDNDVFGNTMRLLAAYPLKSAHQIITIAQQIQRRRIQLSKESPELPRDSSNRRLPLQARLRKLADDTRAASTTVIHTQPEPAERTETMRAATWSTPDSHKRNLLQRYAEVIQDSNAAASLAKASTNLAAKAISWRSGSGSEAPQSTPKKREGEPPELPIPSVIDSPDDLDAYRGPRGLNITGSPLRMHAMFSSPSSSFDDSFANMSSGTQLVLPSMRAAARLGISSPKSDDNRVLSAPRPLLLSSSSREATPSRSMRARQTSAKYASPLTSKWLPPISNNMGHGHDTSGEADTSIPYAAAPPIHAALRISPPRFRPDNPHMTPPPSTSSRSSLQLMHGLPMPAPPIARGNGAASPKAVEHLDALIEQMQSSDLMTKNQPA
ncbi:hypothetical protein MCUN1_000171 [Malassezia cuniculi]|uniref:Rab-GAP TBC domain-containing protein n=1 Tax=Malassezia cuniculi TaxID=948313 RepID=A0AAF0J4M7_9BASI|nr:hypothetical protein MCUN1_000171 [Malassezia cuniculi]